MVRDALERRSSVETDVGVPADTKVTPEFGSYLLPLCVLELYLRAKDSASGVARSATAILLFAISAYMVIGTFAFTMLSLQILG